MKVYRYSLVYYDKYTETCAEEHGITFGKNVSEAIKNLSEDYDVANLEAIKLEQCYTEGDATASFEELKVVVEKFVPLDPKEYD